MVWLRKQGYRVSGSANGGHRHVLEALNFKRMGVAAGFPDVQVPIPSGPYHGFFIEMKRSKGGRLTPDQIDWLSYLREHDYYAEVAEGFEHAKEHFLHYISFTKKAA
ncbi:MAG TPA: VRR-NUC domain-containing protein [Saprospiraceae bacterium]|nr:VRR-NUC domain-containing protein [Saprospiraceae bacterium]